MRICLIGATHPCHNPRLVREADALAERGHQVRVVAVSSVPELVEEDEQLCAARKWSLRSASVLRRPLRNRLRAMPGRMRRALATRQFRRTGAVSEAEAALCEAAPALFRFAAAEPADWFIAHTQPVLGVAAKAAGKWNARLGFDCEDLLAEVHPREAEMVRALERTYLPACEYVSVTSCAMAGRLRQQYGIEPVVLYNVFPLQHAEGLRAPAERDPNSALRLHWVGQTIGPGKGLEEALEAAALAGAGVELWIRGTSAGDYGAQLERAAREKHVPLTLLPPVHHDQLVGTMAEYDVGLALERQSDPNYSITVTNKFFLYMLAGLAVAATDTPGQSEVLQQAPASGFMYPSGRPEVLAAQLRRWRDERGILRAAQSAAWAAARDRFCWDGERTRYLELVECPASRKRGN